MLASMTMMNNAIIYEQPLNELIRAALRLEQLFYQVDHLITDTSILGTRNTIAVIISILHLLDRPDLKAKLAKELSYQMTLLTRLESTPEIDHVKLKKLLYQLDELSRCFIDSSGKIGQNLRGIELLNNLRLHLANPGSGYSFDIPIYHYWLNRPSEERLDTIHSWLNEFNNIRLAIKLVLQLIREGTKILPKQAENGFYQELLDPQTNLRLIRVAVPTHLSAYPEVSISRHFLGIRFFNPEIQGRPSQYQDNLPFWVSYCN